MTWFTGVQACHSEHHATVQFAFGVHFGVHISNHDMNAESE